MLVEFDEVMTISEAAKRWGKPVETLRSRFRPQNGKPPVLTEQTEGVRRSGNTWLITAARMRQLYGPDKEWPGWLGD